MTVSPPKEPDLCNCLAIRKAARHVTSFYDRYLASAGLRTTQYSILAGLMRRGPRTINELAADLSMDRTTMGRNVKPLEREGLVAIMPDPRDRRARAVSLTPAGHEKIAEARDCWAQAQTRFEHAYGADEARQLRATLASLLGCDLGAATSTQSPEQDNVG